MQKPLPSSYPDKHLADPIPPLSAKPRYIWFTYSTGLKDQNFTWSNDFFLNTISFFKDFIYSWETQREKEREAETQAEGEAGSLWGPRCGTRSQDSGVTPWAEGRGLTAEPPRHPYCEVQMQREKKASEAGSGWLNVRSRSYKPCSHFSFNLREMERHTKDLRSDLT